MKKLLENEQGIGSVWLGNATISSITRERERKLEAHNAAFISSVEELEKKIQLKVCVLYC